MEIAKSLKKGESRIVKIKITKVTFDGNFTWNTSEKEEIVLRDATVGEVKAFVEKKLKEIK
jgi:hypothetical protein